MRISNSINSGFGYNISAGGPIDSRMLVEYFDDLISEDTWEKHSNPSDTFKGMFVAVKESSKNYPENGPGIYLLVGDDYKNPESWQKSGGDGNWNEVEEGNVIELLATSEGNDLGLEVFFCNKNNGAEIIEVSENQEKTKYWRILKNSRIISPELILPEQTKEISVSIESLDPEVNGLIQVCTDYGQSAEEETWINLDDLDINSLFDETGNNPILFRISFVNNSLEDGWEIKNIIVLISKDDVEKESNV